MITDKIENLNLYKNIPEDAIRKIASAITNGKYIISDNCYINVEEYKTKNVSDGKFEAHKKYIDVQILLSGREDIYYTNIKNLKSIFTPYNEEKDIIFYCEDINPYNKITLDGTNFVILEPQDAHAPQISPQEGSNIVKKVVIKIKL